jgi:hypothetical protein
MSKARRLLAVKWEGPVTELIQPAIVADWVTCRVGLPKQRHASAHGLHPEHLNAGR